MENANYSEVSLTILQKSDSKTHFLGILGKQAGDFSYA